MVPSSRGPISLYLTEISFESRLSVLKNVCQWASESETWGETMGESQSSRNSDFSSGKLHEGQKRRLYNPDPSPWLCGKGRLHVDFTALWVRAGIRSHQSCRIQATWSRKHSHSDTDVTEPHSAHQDGGGEGSRTRRRSFRLRSAPSPTPRWPQAMGGHVII